MGLYYPGQEQLLGMGGAADPRLTGVPVQGPEPGYDLVGQMSANPMLQMGLGMMAANGPGASLSQTIGRGAMMGMTAMQRNQALKQQNELRDLQKSKLQYELKEVKEESRAREQLNKTLSDPNVPPEEKYSLQQSFDQIWNPTPPTALQRNVTAMGHMPGSEGYQQAMREAVMKPSMSVKVGAPQPAQTPFVTGYDEQGRPIFNTGDKTSAALNTPLEKPTRGYLEKQTQVLGDQLALINSMKAKFKPEFHQYGTQLQQWWNNKQQKLGVKLEPAQEQMLSEYTAYKAETMHYMMEYLAALSGAAVTESEAKRALDFMPHKDDGPSQILSKMNNLQEYSRMTIARANIALQTGTKWQTMTHNYVKGIMSHRATLHAKSLAAENPTMSREQIIQIARQKMEEDFGLYATPRYDWMGQ